MEYQYCKQSKNSERLLQNCSKKTKEKFLSHLAVPWHKFLIKDFLMKKCICLLLPTHTNLGWIYMIVILNI